MQSFAQTKSSRNGKITLSITDIGKSCTSCEFLAPEECLLTLFAKNKILAKISRFTVPRGHDGIRVDAKYISIKLTT